MFIRSLTPVTVNTQRRNFAIRFTATNQHSLIGGLAFLSNELLANGQFQVRANFVYRLRRSHHYSRYEYVKSFERVDILLPNTWIVVRIDGRGFHK